VSAIGQVSQTCNQTCEQRPEQGFALGLSSYTFDHSQVSVAQVHAGTQGRDGARSVHTAQHKKQSISLQSKLYRQCGGWHVVNNHVLLQNVIFNAAALHGLRTFWHLP
jgi:hypothetical protein